MCWSMRDELREQEEAEEEERGREAYERRIAEWWEQSKREAEALLPYLLDLQERTRCDCD